MTTYTKTVKGKTVVLANLSRHHPDAGLTLKEHLAMKAKRAAGRVKFIPKEASRAAGKTFR